MNKIFILLCIGASISPHLNGLDFSIIRTFKIPTLFISSESTRDDEFFEKENIRQGFEKWLPSQTPQEVYEAHMKFLDASMLKSIKQVYVTTHEDRYVKNMSILETLAKAGMPAAKKYLHVLQHLEFLKNKRKEEKELERFIEHTQFSSSISLWIEWN